MSGDSFSFEAPPHEQWLELPFVGDVDEESAALVEAMIGHSATNELVEATTAWVAGSARIARRDSERLRAEARRPTFAAWVLPPGPVAYLRAGPLGPRATDDEALGSVVDLAAELYGKLDVEDLATASGPALLVPRRPVREVGGVRAVNEHRLVLWPRPELECVVHLSLYILDLVEAGAAAGPLRELASTMHWSIS